MSSTNPTTDGGASQEHLTEANPTPAHHGLVIGEETRRERRRRRRTARRARMARARAAWVAWVATSVDAALPEQVQDRVPGWAATGRGRLLLAGAAVLALLVWALVFVVIAGR